MRAGFGIMAWAAEARAARELDDLRGELARLRAENARLLRLLQLTPGEARPAGPTQTGLFERAPGAVDRSSPLASKVAFFRALFRARDDVYARRWENRTDGRSGWMPAVVGGRLKGVPRPNAGTCR